jgi:hypothetical protein
MVCYVRQFRREERSKEAAGALTSEENTFTAFVQALLIIVAIECKVAFESPLDGEEESIDAGMRCAASLLSLRTFRVAAHPHLIALHLWDDCVHRLHRGCTCCV